MKNSKISILLLFLVMILAISAVSAADTNETSDSDLQAVDEVAADEVASVDVDTLSATDDTDVVAVPDGNNFTSLQAKIDTGSGNILIDQDYKRVAGENTVKINKSVSLISQNDNTIDADGLGGIFEIDPGVTVLIQGLTLINGNANAGGAILNRGTLTMEDCTVSGVIMSSSANFGAVFNVGSLTVNNCTFKDNKINKESNANGGAAIFNGGTDLTITGSRFINNTAPWKASTGAVSSWTTSGVLIKDSYFEGNVARFGGAVNLNDGSVYVNITNCTFDSNSITGPAGLPTTGAAGGAIAAACTAHDFTLEIADSIIKNNYGDESTPSFGAGIRLMDYASGIIKNCTFENNYGTNQSAISVGSYLHPPASLAVDGCTFINNNALDNISVDMNVGIDSVIENCDFSADTNDIAVFNAGTMSLNNNIVSTSAKITNVGTVSSKTNSTVLGNGTYDALYTFDLNATLTDEMGNNIYNPNLRFTINGEVYNVQPGYDEATGVYNITGYVLGFEPTYLVSINVSDATVKYGIINNLVIGTFTDLAAKINAASGELNLTYDFTYDDTIDTALKDGIVIANDLIINGKGFTIDANNVARIFNITNNAKLTLTNATLTKGKADKGAGVYVEAGAELDADNVNFTDNTATYQGGAVYSLGTVIANHTVFDSNDITNRAGANRDFHGGAAIFNLDGTLTVDNSKFINNIKNYVIAGTGGQKGDNMDGAITTSGTANITNSEFRNNSARYGSAITMAPLGNKESTLTVDNCEFYDNVAFAGAIQVWDGDNKNFEFTVLNSYFENNQAIGSSGSQYTSAGGALVINNVKKAEINGTTFKENKVTNPSTAPKGGAINIQDSIVDIDDCTFEDNHADANGGAINVNNGDVSVTNSKFIDNDATTNGGAIHVEKGDVAVEGSNFTGNAAGEGTAIYLSIGTLALSGNTISSTDAEIVNNAGTITSSVNAAFLFNEANNTIVAKLCQTVVPYGKLTDDNGNIIYDLDFKITVDDVEYETSFDNVTGIYSATYTIKHAGDNIVSTNYNAANIETGIYNVSKENVTKFTVTVENITLGNAANVVIALTGVNDNALSGNVTVYLNNTKYIIEVINGTGNRTIEGLALGSYSVFATFEDTNYNEAFNSTVFYVRTTTILTVDPVNPVDFGTPVTFTIHLTVNGTDAPMSGLVLVGYDMTDDMVVVRAGEATYTVPNDVIATLNKGDHEFVFIFEGDNYYNSSETRVTVTVNVKNLTEDDINVTFEGSAPDDVNVTVSGPDGTYNVTVDGQTYQVDVIDGTGSNLIPVSRIGVNYATIAIDDDNYNLTPFTVEFTYPPLKGTYSDLQYLIDTSGDYLFLPYDFAYDPAYDANAFPDGVVISKDIYIDGNLSTISGEDAYRIFYVTNGATLTLCEAILTGGNADVGGAIYVDSGAALNASDVAFYENVAIYAGGAVYSIGDVIVNYTVFDSNDITNRSGTNRDFHGGAAIYNLDSTLTVDNSKFINNIKNYVINTLAQKGDNICGAITTSGTATIMNSEFRNNSASYGSAIEMAPLSNDDNKANSLTVDNCEFYDNTAMDGAIQVWDPGHVSEFTVLNSYFENNTAVGADITNGVQYTSSAGAINTINLNKGTIKGTTFIGNKVIEPSISPVGGAIKATNTNIDIDDCTFENNYAAASGGAVYLTGNANVSNCNFISNVAVNNGGAIFAYLPQGTLNINDCNFTDNKAGNGGAAIYAHTGDVNIDGATFTGNNATNGAAIYVKPTATASVEDSTFDSNTANNGEAIYVEDSGSLTVDTSTFVDVIATITVNDTYTFGDLITIEGIFDWGVNNATIEMTYTINGAKQTVNATEGAYTITIDNQPDVGTYTIVISTFTDAEGNTYIVDSVQATFTIVKATPEIAIEIDPVTYGNYPEITINLTGIYSVGIPDASLVVTITDDDMNMYQYPVVTDENGTVFIAPILVLAPGTYNVTVNYGGGDNYETANKTESFTVIQTVITEMISVNDENVTIGEGIEITVTNITGLVEGDLIEVNLTVTNATGDDVFTEKYNITVGSAISVPALPAGSYSYAVTFTGDDKYTVGAASGISAIGFFNVDKINVTGNVSITGSEITYGENGTITADFVEFAGAKDASGNVTVTFINVPGEFRAAVVGGIAVVEIPGLAGNKTYEVKSVVYTGDDTYSGFTIEDSNIVIKVAQAPSKIEILGGLARTVYPGSITVVYRIVNATEVNICVRDGKDKVIFNQTLTGDEGRMIIDSFQITGLAVDTYSVSITNNETSNYLYYGVSDSFDVDRATPEISVGVQDVIYGNPAVATVTISENATGNVTVIINGKEYSAEIKQGTAIANIEAEYLIVGENKVNVFYDGDTNYTMNHNSTNFTVNQATIKIDSEVITQEPKYGSPVEVTVNVTGFVDGDNMELDIVLLRNNVLYFNGTFTFSGNDTYVFENLIAGEYNYTISYDGTGNYKPDSFTTGFTVSPVQLEVNATGNNNVTYADNYELSIATFGVDGYLDVKDVYVAIFDANTVEVYNKTIDINGRDKLSIPVNFKPGEYTILVSVPVQGINYYGDADTVALTVNKVNLTDKVTIKGSEIIYGDNGTITVDFPITYDAQVGGTVNVTLKEVNGIFTANVEGGLAIVEIPELPGNKTYEVASVKYSGDDYFEGFAFDDDNIVIKVAQAESSVTVLTFGNGTYPGNLNVIYMVQNATEVHIQVLKGLELVYNNTLTGDEGRMVLNGFNLTGLSVGSYTVIVSNNATGNYKFAMNYATFTVEKAAPEISIEVQNVIYDNPAVATVTISENATGNVTIIINGKEYSAEIKQGTATADIEAEFIILGENKVNVLYDGDANYTMNRNSTNFTAYGNVVTNDTFFTYFDQNGLLRDEVKFDELFFDGLFSDLPGIDRITAGYIDITGINDAVLYNIGLDVSYSSVSDIMFFADEAIGDLITAYDSVEISDVIINYTVANATEDAIAINVVGSDVAICDSEIYFESHAAYDSTEAMAINVDGDDVVIDNNKIVANLTAVRSTWSIYFQYGTMGIDKVHAIRITGSDIELTDNEIDAVINDGISTGEYDSPTIEAVLVIDSENVLIYNNTITVTDPITPEGTPSYLYGMTLTAVDNVNVTDNTFVLDTDGGIEAAGAAYAIQLATCNIDIFDNDIISSSNGPNIGIYISGVATEMYGNPNPFYKKNFTVDIGFNNIDINGYSNSTNYGSLVSGIEACAGEITIALNEISVVNNAGFDENAGVYGISYAQTYYPYVPSFDIQQNNIEVNGNYAVAIINDAEALVTDNVLIADNLGDESVFANETLSTVERNYPAPLNITTSADNVTVDSPVVINVNTNTLFTGNVTLIFGSEEYNVSIVDGVGSYVLEDLAAADYDYTIEYIGFSYKYDDLFISDYADGNFTVLKYVTEIEVIPGEIIVDEDLAVELNIQKLNGTVSVIVDSTPIDDVSVVNGVGNFTIPKDIMTAGNHSIIVIVADNPKYENNQTTFTFTVEKAENYTFDVNLTFYEIKYGENATFNVTLPEDANGNLTVYVNDELVASVPVENGTASVTVPASAFETGFDTIAVSYGDDKYANTTVSTDIYVERIPGELYAGANNISIGENATVLVYIPTYTDGRVFVELLGIKYPVKIENNTGYVTIEGLDEGNYTALVSFEDDDIYLDNDTYVFFTVTKVVIPPEQAFNITTPENTTSQVISVELPEDATGFLLLEVNGTQTFVPLENGKANVTVPKLLEGAYNATITYTGDSKYAPITTTQEINVTSNVPDSALSIPESGKTDAPTTYSISLPSDATGFLTVDVDGTKHIASLVNGSANVTVPALSAGNHNVTVTYTGDTNYSPVVKSTTLNVTDPVFKITNNKNINVVYSAKATYKVLITRDGKAVGAGEKVTIKFNGKTYTVKTDAKGYATLKLKTKVKVKKYTITATYKGVTVKNTVKVKHVIKAKNRKVNKSKKAKKAAKAKAAKAAKSSKATAKKAKKRNYIKVKVSLKKVNGKYLKGKKITIKFKGKKYKIKTNKKGKAVWKLKKSKIKKLKVGKKYKFTATYGKDKVTKKLIIK